MNKVIGLILVLLYFGGSHIAYHLDGGNVDFFWDIKVSIYSIIIVLAWHYKPTDSFLEKLFISMVINNIYVLLMNGEHDYSFNDIVFVSFFTALQYAKSKGHLIVNTYRQLADFLISKNKKA